MKYGNVRLGRRRPPELAHPDGHQQAGSQCRGGDGKAAPALGTARERNDLRRILRDPSIRQSCDLLSLLGKRHSKIALPAILRPQGPGGNLACAERERA